MYLASFLYQNGCFVSFRMSSFNLKLPSSKEYLTFLIVVCSAPNTETGMGTPIKAYWMNGWVTLTLIFCFCPCQTHLNNSWLQNPFLWTRFHSPLEIQHQHRTNCLPPPSRPPTVKRCWRNMIPKAFSASFGNMLCREDIVMASMTRASVLLWLTFWKQLSIFLAYSLSAEPSHCSHGTWGQS